MAKWLRWKRLSGGLMLALCFGVGGLIGCVTMIDLRVTNRLPFEVSVSDQFIDIRGQLVEKRFGVVPANGVKTFERAVARGNRCHLVIRANGRVVRTVDGPINTEGNRASEFMWSLTVKP